MQKIEPTCNGEYTPPALEPRVQRVRFDAMQVAADSARRLGLSRGSYQVPKGATLDPAEASFVLSGAEFIFDVQTRHVDAARKWWEATPPEQNMAGFLKRQQAQDLRTQRGPSIRRRHAEMRKAQRFDAVVRARLEYQNGRSPSHLTYGPRTAREQH